MYYSKPLCLALGLIIITCTAVYSEPLDRNASDILKTVRTVQLHSKTPKLSQEELKSIMAAGEADSVVVRMAVAYALAFTDAKDGKQALEKLGEDKDADVASVAEFSTFLNGALDLNSEERLSLLSFRLAQSDRRWLRTLLVARLGDEYKANVVPMLLAALKGEKDPLVRTEMFFQAALYGNQQQLKEIDTMLQHEKKDSSAVYHEATCMFLNAVSTNKNERDSLPGRINRLVESRLKAMDSSSGK